MIQKLEDSLLRNRKEESIAESKCNEVYKRINDNETYLTGKLKKNKRRMIARFRCGNEFRGGKCWKAEADKACRRCGEERETAEHVMRIHGENRQLKDFLDEYGSGVEMMENILEEQS